MEEDAHIDAEDCARLATAGQCSLSEAQFFLECSAGDYDSALHMCLGAQELPAATLPLPPPAALDRAASLPAPSHPCPRHTA